MKECKTMRAFSFFFFIVTCLLGIACAILELAMIYRIAVAVMVCIAIYLTFKYTKCSKCNEYAVNGNPFSKKYGICQKCGHKD
jgi:hypothetical protein